MFKLTDSLGRVVFQSNFELTNEDIAVNDNERYTLSICNNRWCLGAISVELYVNDSMCKKVDILEGRSGYISFRTGVSDSVIIRIYPFYEATI